MSPGAAAGAIAIAVKNETSRVKEQVAFRTARGSKELRNAAIEVLKGPSPSAPGATPGVRSGDLRDKWDPFDTPESFGIKSAMGYSGYLERGTRKMAARPYVDKIQQEAMPKIRSIFSEIGG